jgi:hypothetical protein
MCDEPLTDELREIEGGLIPLMRFEPQAEIGGRILGAMRGQLRRERSAARWRFSLQLAVCAFVWLHLSYYVAPTTSFHLGANTAAIRNHLLDPKHSSVLSGWLHEE